MTRRFEPWIVGACLVIVVSPVIHSLTSGAGVDLGAILVGLVMGGIVVAFYVRMLRRARTEA
jgi:hypothetical protein